MNYKAFSKAMRENKVIDEKGNIICSPQLWEQIATVIENVAINNENKKCINCEFKEECCQEIHFKESGYIAIDSCSYGEFKEKQINVCNNE